MTVWRALVDGAVLLVVVGTARSARAQVKWDVGAEAKLVKRFTSGGSSGVAEPAVGPGVEIKGHVAVVPMVRVGLFAAADLAPGAGAGDAEIGQRSFGELGGELRVSPPLLPAPWRTWAFAGVGYTVAYASSYAAGGGARVHGESGSFLDVPLGLGLGYRVQPPWTVFVEGGCSFGAGFFGPLYDGPPGLSGPTPSASHSPPFPGHDSFAISLALGLSFDL